MADTLDALVAHLERTHGQAKAVVWAHNSHLGDARATEMGPAGQITVGQLARRAARTRGPARRLDHVLRTVTAASDWGGPAERKHVRPALAGSWEALFHEQDPNRASCSTPPSLRSRAGSSARSASSTAPRPSAIRTTCTRAWRDQFDMVLHFDETRALVPLERTSLWEAGELPETYPSGL